MGSAAFFSCRPRTMISECFKLVFGEAGQNGIFALLPIKPVGEFGIDLDHASDEELFLFGGVRFPVIRLDYRHQETGVFCPRLVLLQLGRLRVRMHVVFYSGQFVHFPRFANGKTPIGILAPLVDPDQLCLVHRDDYNALLLVFRFRVWRSG
jgi:hypothetical protein